MTSLADSFDPWGPLSLALFEVGNADFVEDAVSATGLISQWKPLSTAESYSNSTRIRARKPEVGAAYYALPEAHRGPFVQGLLRSVFERPEGETIRGRLEDRLGAIGWGLDADNRLVTQDALVSEAFFPPNSTFDAYISIRQTLGTAKTELTVVDAYLGKSLLATLRAVAPSTLSVRLLTVAKNLRPDFTVELAAFRKQFPGIAVDIRTSADFHDRFIVVDDARFFHVGASIKDAGARAFMISEIEDPANIASIRAAVGAAWAASAPF